jgi:hypothetical protein
VAARARSGGARALADETSQDETIVVVFTIFVKPGILNVQYIVVLLKVENPDTFNFDVIIACRKA